MSRADERDASATGRTDLFLPVASSWSGGRDVSWLGGVGATGDITGLGVARLERRLRAGREETFVGRADELAVFSAALTGEADQPRLLYVHGPAGIGKTQLTERFTRMAESAGRVVVRIDARTVRPTTEAFVQAARQALCVERPVLVIDSFERHEDSLVEWFRDSFLPWMPEGALVVVAGVRPLPARWRADPAWSGSLRVLPLGALSVGEAAELLRRRGTPPAARPAILEFAGGHPLALTVAALTVRPGDDGWTPTGRVLKLVLARLVGELPSPAHREVLELCAHAPVTTEDLLRRMHPPGTGADAAALFAWLRRLPYVDAVAGGLVLQPVVREAVDADLRWRDAETYEQVHRRLRAVLVDRAGEACGDAVLPALAALSVLTRTGPGLGPATVTEEPVTAHDVRFLLTAAARDGGPGPLLGFWLARRPEAFRVLRAPGGGRIGIVAVLELSGFDLEEVGADPAVAAAWAHSTATAPLRPGETLRIVRFVVPGDVSEAGGAAASAGVLPAALGLRVLAELVRGEPSAWSYLVTDDAGPWEPLAEAGALHPVPFPGGSGTFLARDGRTMPPAAFWELVDRRPGAGGPAPGPQRARLVLSRPEFDSAVRDLLRWWRRPERLAANPLLRTRLVEPTPAAGDGGAGGEVEALKAVAAAELKGLQDEARSVKPAQAVGITYLRGTPTQQVAADQLGLPFSTYRRHLVAGVERLAGRLWAREIYGTPSG
jgi:AAA ATPase domain